MNANNRALERLGCKISRRGYYPRFVRAVVWMNNGEGLEVFSKCNWRNYPWREWKIRDRGDTHYTRTTPEHVLFILEKSDSFYATKWGVVKNKDRPHRKGRFEHV